jgi:hypothetical protein
MEVSPLDVSVLLSQIHIPSNAFFLSPNHRKKPLENAMSIRMSPNKTTDPGDEAVIGREKAGKPIVFVGDMCSRKHDQQKKRIADKK